MSGSVLEMQAVEVLLCVSLTLPVNYSSSCGYVISNFSEADVLRIQKSFLVVRLWKLSSVTSVQATDLENISADKLLWLLIMLCSSVLLAFNPPFSYI